MQLGLGVYPRRYKFSIEIDDINHIIILGYITACKYSKATYMGVKKMLEQYRKVPILIENGIEDADIVRYTRYWLRYYYNISDINNMNLVPREHEPIIREADNRDELRRQFLRRDTYGDEDEEEF